MLFFQGCFEGGLETVLKTTNEAFKEGKVVFKCLPVLCQGVPICCLNLFKGFLSHASPNHLWVIKISPI